jgi:thymidylate kinase
VSLREAEAASAPGVGWTTGDGHPGRGDEVPALALVRSLCEALDAAGVSYCHWKSNEALAASARGDNDLDLLVSRRDAQLFTELVARLGFKEARLPPVRERPGVLHYYGLDVPSGRLVHIHAHYLLVLGDDTTKNYRLPIEEPYLALAALQGPFRVPAAEFELAVFTVRMILKHATWDAIAYRRGRLARSERRELAYLAVRTDPGSVTRVVAEHLPQLADLWEDCDRCLRPGCSAAFRVRVARRLTRRLAACGTRRRGADTALRVWRRGAWGIRRYVLRRRTSKRLLSGGALIAFVGGDGAGKSTAVAGLSSWLSAAFATRSVHLGKPPRSVTTLAIKGPMYVARKLGLFRATLQSSLPAGGQPARFPGYAWLVWHVLTARDRYREYVDAQRFAARGGIVVCDRYPLPELRLMDGARTAWVLDLPGLPRLARHLARLERRYYERIGDPDVLIVLRVDPDIAVQRKTNEEAGYVRVRNEEVWRQDWAGRRASVVDAVRPQDDVLAAVRSLVWARL